jgi:hypothetical protein
MTLIDFDGFDVSTTSSHYTTGRGWDATNSSMPNPSTASSRNAAGNGLPMTAANARAMRKFSASEEDDLIIAGVAYKPTAFNTTGLNVIFQLLSDDGATIHLTIGHTAAGKIRVTRGDFNGTTLGDEAGTTFSALNSYKQIEVKARLHDSTGSVEVRVDGNTTPVINLSSQDTKNGGTKTVFDAIYLRGNLSTANGGQGQFDDFYVCNEQSGTNNDFLGDVVVQTVFPSGNGATSNLVGSDGNSTDNYLLVDETAPNTSDYNGSATVDQKDTYAMGNTSGTPTSIRAVRLNAYAAKSDAGSRSFALVVRSGGTEADSSDIPLSTTFQYYGTIFLLDPTDSNAWSQAKVDGIEAGFKVR